MLFRNNVEKFCACAYDDVSDHIEFPLEILLGISNKLYYFVLQIMIRVHECMRLRIRRSKGNYYTYEITLPKKLVEALGWREGMELEAKVYVSKDIRGVLIKPKYQKE